MRHRDLALLRRVGRFVGSAAVYPGGEAQARQEAMESPRQVTRQVISSAAALLAFDTQVGSDPKKDATIKQSSTSMTAAVSQARWINRRRTVGSYGGSGF